MKKIFTIGFLLLIQYACTAGEEEDQFTRLSKTHKIEVRPQTGETIFYPKEYKNYQEFKEKSLETKYVTELLAKRLIMLCDFRELLGESSEKGSGKYLYHQNCLDRNQIALVSNAKQGALDSIKFSETYDNALTNHIIDVASLLKRNLSTEDKSTQEKLDKLIEKFRSWQKEEERVLALGSTSTLKPENAELEAAKTQGEGGTEEEEQQESKASPVESSLKGRGKSDIWEAGIEECFRVYEWTKNKEIISRQEAVDALDNLERLCLVAKTQARAHMRRQYHTPPEQHTYYKDNEPPLANEYLYFDLLEAAISYINTTTIYGDKPPHTADRKSVV